MTFSTRASYPGFPFSCLCLVMLLSGAILPGAATAAGPAPLYVIVEIDVADEATALRLIASHDVWEARRDIGVLTARVSLGELRDLSEQGLEPRINWQRTEEEANPADHGQLGPGSTIPGYACYRTVEGTFSSLQQLALDHPDLASWVDIGDSWEKLSGTAPGYDIYDLVLTQTSSQADKAPFFLLAAIHARELTTAELATRFAESLVQGYGVDPDATWILDHTEIHIIAQGNPDGRKRAETGLFWRKNADNDHCSNSNDRGIDLNRNSSFRWATAGSSSSACSTVFHGPGPASEPETQAFEALMSQIFEDQRGPADSDAAPLDATGLFISIHSSGEWVLFPWDGITALAPNFTELQTLGRKFGFWNGYKICQTANCLYQAAGGTSGASYGDYGVATYTFELGTTFFQDCPSFENTIFPDNLPVLYYAAKAARRPYRNPAGPDALSLALSEPVTTQGQLVTLTATVDDSRYDSGGFGSEPVQTIASAAYSVDAPPWAATAEETLQAVDGSFDSAAEAVTATLDTTSLAPGRHLVYVYGTDSAGNQGVPSAIFLEIMDPASIIFTDGFESGDTSAWALTIGG